MQLNEKQIEELAGAFTKMVDSMREFFNDPQNKKQYQEWHLKKYGYMPEEAI